jgi:2-hydroxychromene-2-carboxylate isomerase
MGDLAFLSEWRAAGRPAKTGGGGMDGSAPGADALSARTPPEFLFDLGCPFSYLAAERVERLFGTVAWIPTASIELRRSWTWSDPDGWARTRCAAETRAAELRLPLVWPDRFPIRVPMALRAAAYAAEIGAGAAFALAAMRLTYCGGFDLDDPEVLAEAAAAAAIELDECLAAARDPERDGALLATARDLIRHGVDELPAIRIGDCHIAGERRLAEAAARLRAGADARRAVPAG